MNKEKRERLQSQIGRVAACDYRGLHSLSRLSLLREMFPHTQVIRAGFLLFSLGEEPHCEEIDLLFVHQRSAVIQDPSGSHKIVEALKGPPKGSAEQSDVTALATAERELFEETGICVHSPLLDVGIYPTMIIVARPHTRVQEIIVYFLAFVRGRPPVRVCQRELTGYSWESAKLGGIWLRVRDVASPTRAVLQSLDYLDIYSDPLSHCWDIPREGKLSGGVVDSPKTPDPRRRHGSRAPASNI